MPRRLSIAVTVALAAFAVSSRAHAQTLALGASGPGATGATQPMWVETPGASADPRARAQFAAAVHRRGLTSPEVVALAASDARSAADLLAQGKEAWRASNVVLASALFGQAAAAATASGGDGLTSSQLASIFFHQPAALQAASGATLTEPLTDISPDDAKAAYLRAALTDSTLSIDDASPLARASWRLAVSEIQKRAKATLAVRARPGAAVSIDAGPARPSPVSGSLPYGEHLIHVSEPGHEPWSSLVTVAQPNVLIEVRGTQLASYDPASAAEAGRSRGAAFVLVGQLHLGDKVEIDLRLVDSQSGETVDATAVPLVDGSESAPVEAAVLRLDELAQRISLGRRATAAGRDAHAPLGVATPPIRIPPPAPASPAPSQSWLMQHWPVATAVAIAAGTTLVLGIVVAKDH